MTNTSFVQTDGGRADHGFKGTAGDCVARSLALAAGVSYGEAYAALSDAQLIYGRRSNRHRSAREGIDRRAYDHVFASYGATWTPTMTIGSGTRVHLRADELPNGRLIVRLSRHLCAVIDGVIHDTYDPSREGTRAVYGYWTFPEDAR